MAIQELAYLTKRRSKFDSEKRVSFHEIARLLAKCSNDLVGEWNCLVVPQQDICQTIRPQSDLREDCQGNFIAILITQFESSSDYKNTKQNMKGTRVTRKSLYDCKRRLLTKSTTLSDWLLRLIYTAQGMDLLVKPLFHFPSEIIRETLQLPNNEQIRLILLIGYPTSTEPTESLSPYIRFYTKHNVSNEL